VTVLEVIQRSAEFLARKGVGSPRLQVELLLAHTLAVPRLRLYLDFERQLTESELTLVRELVKRRAAREPLQHIIGSTSFCGLEIKVTNDVLIPRPETEVLAEQAWQFLRSRSGPEGRAVSVLDFGTGSGCLAIALARQVPTAQVWAVDLSAAALDVARENAARHKLSDHISFLQSDGFRALRAGQRFDLIVANPPYIPSQEIGRLAPEVRDHDPRLALDGGQDGLALFRRLAAEADDWLLPGARLMCEFGDGQTPALQRIFTQSGWQIVAILSDLARQPRILVACRVQS
jgi:release factor glutamine methyltransferase